MRLAITSLVPFGAAAAAVGLFNAYFGDPAMMPLTASIDSVARRALACGSAAWLVAAGVGLCRTRTALPSAAAIAAYQAACIVASVAPILTHPIGFGSWYGLCEALTWCSGTAIIVGSSVVGMGRTVRAARIVFAMTCIFYGASHFAYARFTANMVPAWLPVRLGWAYATGLCYIAAGIGIITGILNRLAAVLVATMMSLFGLLVWVPSLFANPKPTWATPLENQFSELVVNAVLAASAWVVADSLRRRRRLNAHPET